MIPAFGGINHLKHLIYLNHLIFRRPISLGSASYANCFAATGFRFFFAARALFTSISKSENTFI